MRWLVGAAVAVSMLLLAAGALTGRVRARSCCTVADPRRDTRMRGAFEQTPPTRRPAQEEADLRRRPEDVRRAAAPGGGWTNYLARLAAVAEGRDPGRDVLAARRVPSGGPAIPDGDLA